MNMKKLMVVPMVILVVLFAVSCKSTGSTSAGGQESELATEDQKLEDIYTRYDRGIILNGATTYTVAAKDSLVAIAASHYNRDDIRGRGAFFPLIIAASNEAGILDPDQIEPGMKLTIPDLQVNLDDPTAHANLKSLIQAVIEIYQAKPKSKNTDDTLAGLTSVYSTL